MTGPTLDELLCTVVDVICPPQQYEDPLDAWAHSVDRALYAASVIDAWAVAGFVRIVPRCSGRER